MAQKHRNPAMQKFGGLDLRELLAERDRQVAHLRQQLDAHIERNMLLETRLLSTQDALDDVRISSTEEVRMLERENARLIRKCETYEKISREAEKESADMKESILQLIAKVESCNDYSKWQASSLQLSRSLTISAGSRATTGLPAQHHGVAECTCPNAYSPTVIEELSSLLNWERRNHEATVEQAERRITILEARIAVRELELAEFHTNCRCQASAGPSKRRQKINNSRVTLLTTERNRRLRAEVRNLAAELQHEQVMQNTDHARNEQVRPPSFTSRGTQTDPECMSSRSQGVTPAQQSSFPRPSLQPRADAVQSEGSHERQITSAVRPGLDILSEELVRLRARLEEVVGERDSLRKLIERTFPIKAKEFGATSGAPLQETNGQNPGTDSSPTPREENQANQAEFTTQAFENERDLFVSSPPNRETLNETFPPLLPSPPPNPTTAPESLNASSLTDASTILTPTESAQISFSTEVSVLRRPSTPNPPQTPVTSVPSSLPQTPLTPRMPLTEGVYSLFGQSMDFASPSHPADELASPMVSFAHMHLGFSIEGSPTPPPGPSRTLSRARTRAASPRLGVFRAPSRNASPIVEGPSANFQGSPIRLGTVAPRLDAIERALAEERDTEAHWRREMEEVRGSIEDINERLAHLRERGNEEHGVP